MDAKTVAATARTAIRQATRTEGDPLHGLTVSVRTSHASEMTAIDVRVTAGVTDEDLHRPSAERAEHGLWTERARLISERLHELAAPALAWAAEVHRMRFCSISYEDSLAPAPRITVDDERDAELERRNAAERADMAEIPDAIEEHFTALDELHAEQEPAVITMDDVIVPDPAGQLLRGLLQRAGVDSARRMVGLPAAEPYAPPAGPARLRVLPGGRTTGGDGADRAPVAMHVVTEDESYVLAALGGSRGRVEQVAAQVVTLDAMQGDYLTDAPRMARMLRDLLAAHATTP